MTSPLLEAPLVQTIGRALLNFVWQGALIGAAAAIALRALRGAPAATRYAVACAALAVMLLAPVSSILFDGAGGSMDLAFVPAAPSEPSAIERLLPVAVLAWMAGVALLSLRLAAAFVGVERLKRATRNVDATVSARVTALARRIGLHGSVRVLESAIVRVPTVVGCVRPVILIPASVITGLPASHLDAVLAHELAHVRRHDYLVNAIQAIVETLLFYHPAVWWCSRQIRVEREHCCDDVVLEVCGDRMGYATALTELEVLRGLNRMLSLNATGGRLLDRVRRVLGYAPVAEGRSAALIISAALAVVVAVMVMPVMTLAEADAPGAERHDDIALQAPPTPAPPRAPRAPVPPAATAPGEPAPPPAPAVPVAPPPPEAPKVPAPPAPPGAQPVPPFPGVPAQPLPPAPPALPALAPLPPAPPAPPAPPEPPLDIAQIDPDSIAKVMERATKQLAAGFEDLRRATEEINARRDALRQAQAELAKMRLETLAAHTQMEALRRAVGELSSTATSAELGRLNEEALRKQLETIVKQIEELGVR